MILPLLVHTLLSLDCVLLFSILVIGRSHIGHIGHITHHTSHITHHISRIFGARPPKATGMLTRVWRCDCSTQSLAPPPPPLFHMRLSPNNPSQTQFQIALLVPKNKTTLPRPPYRRSSSSSTSLLTGPASGVAGPVPFRSRYLPKSRGQNLPRCRSSTLHPTSARPSVFLQPQYTAQKRDFSSTPIAMTATKIDGTAIAKKIRERLHAEIESTQKINPRYKPSLKIIQGTTSTPILEI
jgi:hypothetical protein